MAYKRKPRTNQKEVEDVPRELSRELTFIKELEGKKEFSVDWFNTILKSILEKCLGESEVTITDKYGNDIDLKVFNPKTALDTARLLAKVNGVELANDVIVVEQSNNIQNNYLNVALESSAEKTASVMSILERVGKLPLLANDEIEEITKQD